MIKFADDYFDELKPGMKLIYVGYPDSEFFTRKTAYEVFRDEEGLIVQDDDGDAWDLDRGIASEFLIHEN